MRPALAALREQGHTPIAWAGAVEQSPASLALLRLALITPPCVGHALSMAAAGFGPRPRLFLLTEQSFFIFAELHGPRGERSPALERAVPIEQLDVRVGALGMSFILRLAPAEPARAFAIDPHHSPCATRLCRALTIMSSNGRNLDPEAEALAQLADAQPAAIHAPIRTTHHRHP